MVVFFKNDSTCDRLFQVCWQTMELFSRRRWRLVSAQLSNKFGNCPLYSDSIVFVSYKHNGRYEPSSPVSCCVPHTNCLKKHHLSLWECAVYDLYEMRGCRFHERATLNVAFGCLSLKSLFRSWGGQSPPGWGHSLSWKWSPSWRSWNSLVMKHFSRRKLKAISAPR